MNTQDDVAGELGNSHPGEDPWSVTAGENCIACHAPTAVLATGGDEATALDYFFTSTNAVFTTNTASAHSDEWPGVGCAACHNPHDPGSLSYFNSGTFAYEVMTNSAQLCGQCHGNLRFPDTDHLSYNILQGTGGIGVPDQQSMGEVTCTDCHMHTSDMDGSNSRMYGGHSWSVTVPEAGGQSTISCLFCHINAQPAAATHIIDGWKTDFKTQDATVSANVARVAAALSRAAPGTDAGGEDFRPHNRGFLSLNSPFYCTRNRKNSWPKLLTGVLTVCGLPLPERSCHVCQATSFRLVL